MKVAVVLGTDWHIVLDPDGSVLAEMPAAAASGTFDLDDVDDAGYVQAAHPVSGGATLDDTTTGTHTDYWLDISSLAEAMQGLASQQRLVEQFGNSSPKDDDEGQESGYGNGPRVAWVVAQVEFLRLLQREAQSGFGNAEACAAGIKYEYDEQPQQPPTAAGSSSMMELAAVTAASFRSYVQAKHAAVQNHQQWFRVLTRQLHQRKSKSGGDRAGLPQLAASGAVHEDEGKYAYLVES